MTVSFQRTEEQQLLATTARRFLEKRATSAVVRELMMSDDAHDAELWREAAAMGWMGLAIPEPYGGAGMGFAELAIVLEEQGRVVFPGPFLSTVVLAANVILEGGNEEQKAEHLPGIANGDALWSLALWERPTGLGADTVQATATQEGDDWILDGTKRWVLDAGLAQTLVVAARTGPEPQEIGLFVVPTGTPGVTIERTPTLDSTRKQGDVTMTGVRVPASSLLAGDARAWPVVERVLALAATAIANEQVGVAQRCLEMSVAYATTRFQFGRAIGSFQAVKHRLADMLVQVEHAKSAAWHAARVTDDAKEFAVAAPLAKSVCSDAVTWIAGETIQVHGGIGFTWEHDAHLYFKRAKSSSLLFGSAHEHRVRLADAVGL